MAIQAGCCLILCVAFYLLQGLGSVVQGNQVRLNHSIPTRFTTNYESASDRQHLRVLYNGMRVQLLLDEFSAAGFSSKFQYLFGNIGIRMKLAPGNSAGTVTAFYLSSQAPLFDEMDFEFLGNVSGQPYILQTNIFAGGKGEREQRTYLWFDPTAAYHEYSVLWNKRQIVFYVDKIPIRVFRKAKGMAYPDSQPVGIYSSIWNGENWATNDGWVKLNWSHAPFVASYEKFHVDACLALNGISQHCIAARNDWWAHRRYHQLSAWGVRKLKRVRRNFLVYDYCTDRVRNLTPPAECAWNVS